VSTERKKEIRRRRHRKLKRKKEKVKEAIANGSKKKAS
jgi:uroporphyrinogen III methyltransferase/synthase